MNWLKKYWIRVRDWFNPPIHGEAGYQRGMLCAADACRFATAREIVLFIVNADVFDRDSFDRGWIDCCKHVLRNRYSWTDEMFDEHCI